MVKWDMPLEPGVLHGWVVGLVCSHPLGSWAGGSWPRYLQSLITKAYAGVYPIYPIGSSHTEVDLSGVTYIIHVYKDSTVNQSGFLIQLCKLYRGKKCRISSKGYPASKEIIFMLFILIAFSANYVMKVIFSQWFLSVVMRKYQHSNSQFLGGWTQQYRERSDRLRQQAFVLSGSTAVISQHKGGLRYTVTSDGLVLSDVNKPPKACPSADKHTSPEMRGCCQGEDFVLACTYFALQKDEKCKTEQIRKQDVEKMVIWQVRLKI